MIRLGLDTLCYHARLEGGEISVEEVLTEASGLGCECVQLPLHHVRDRTVGELEALRRDAQSLGLTLLASGNELGRAREGDDRTVVEERMMPWLERTVALGSSTLRVVSGFYRADLAEHPGLIELVAGGEQRQAQRLGVAAKRLELGDGPVADVVQRQLHALAAKAGGLGQYLLHRDLPRLQAHVVAEGVEAEPDHAVGAACAWWSSSGVPTPVSDGAASIRRRV